VLVVLEPHLIQLKGLKEAIQLFQLSLQQVVEEVVITLTVVEAHLLQITNVANQEVLVVAELELFVAQVEVVIPLL
jgi:hypothetical protein